jgi:uncharacterized membrane protein YjjP (DUF1212 family)
MSDHALADLAVDLATALHRSGAPVHRIEDAVERVLAAYKARGAVIVSPTALWLQVDDSVRIGRLPAADIDLGRMVAVLRFVDRLVARPRPPQECRVGLRRHLDRPDPWSVGIRRSAIVGTSLAAAVLLGGSWADAIAAGGAGALVVGCARLLDPRWEWRPLRNVLIATALGIYGALLAPLGVLPAVVLLAGAIHILPGLSLTTALAELAEGHLTSGSARLLGVVVTLAQLAAGAGLATWLIGPLPSLVPACPLPQVLRDAIPLVAPAGFAVMLSARPRDVPAVWLVALLGWVSSALVGGLWGAAVGGLVVGLLAAPLGRLARIPDLVLIVPGIFLLVPGSLGVRGAEHLLAHDLTLGSTTALLALETAGAIAAGVFAGQALSRPVRNES